MTAAPLGVLGGTFDPIHLAHLRLAEEAREAFGLAEIRFIPSARPPHRDAPGVPAPHRLRMVELAIQGRPALAADDRELRRSAPSYTFDTIEHLRCDAGARTPIGLILGADAFVLFHTWHRWRELLGQVHLIVARRPGFEVAPSDPALAMELGRRRRERSADLLSAPGGHIFLLDSVRLDISASDIRSRLAHGRSVRELVPDAVLGYIESHHLYGRPDAD